MESNNEHKNFYSIEEVSKAVNESKSTLRFWEQNFASVGPLRDSKGIRKYRTEDIRELLKIKKLLKSKGFTLQGAKQFLSSPRCSAIDKVIDDLRRLKEIISKPSKPQDQL